MWPPGKPPEKVCNIARIVSKLFTFLIFLKGVNKLQCAKNQGLMNLAQYVPASSTQLFYISTGNTMLLVKRSLIALFISLGLAGSAMAAPIEFDLSNPELLTESLYHSFIQDDLELDLSAINLSYGIQTSIGDFNFLKSEVVKTNTPAQVPEPNSIMLLALGLIGLTALRRRKH
ncbi:MAG TPA: PEP-CTERM sorting domain-containing protein [Cellvibrio sp.]|nr:PEP-CTERM sorting domain-containing protein [Cellvibrio sp.]